MLKGYMFREGLGIPVQTKAKHTHQLTDVQKSVSCSDALLCLCHSPSFPLAAVALKRFADIGDSSIRTSQPTYAHAT